MSDLISGDTEQKGEGGRGYVDALKALHAEANRVKDDVEEIKSSLEESYPAEALTNLSRRFETISENFTNYTLININMFYEILHRSPTRLEAANAIAGQALTVAKLFAAYARNPDSYNALDSRHEITKLIAQLVNLVNAAPGETDS